MCWSMFCSPPCTLRYQRRVHGGLQNIDQHINNVMVDMKDVCWLIDVGWSTPMRSTTRWAGFQTLCVACFQGQASVKGFFPQVEDLVQVSEGFEGVEEGREGVLEWLRGVSPERFQSNASALGTVREDFARLTFTDQ
eukprot:NODE_5994_length_538_cov_13.987730_g5245_i0.p1 GENE.NODE_5994_length_538_cov_13.987730_g5245_i0~~NODE_5994_length_538_cov_13.987730_g5245_i0.p1  ORF type:complete len:137 (+),score=53.82 NODE_5994_length_538_cov_13.987730_g5245_i0:2-412(+)